MGESQRALSKRVEGRGLQDPAWVPKTRLLSAESTRDSSAPCRKEKCGREEKAGNGVMASEGCRLARSVDLDNSVEGVHTQVADYLKLGVSRSQPADSTQIHIPVLKTPHPPTGREQVALQHHEATAQGVATTPGGSRQH